MFDKQFQFVTPYQFVKEEFSNQKKSFYKKVTSNILKKKKFCLCKKCKLFIFSFIAADIHKTFVVVFEVVQKFEVVQMFAFVA